MAGPLATIFDIYKNEHMNKKIAAPIWVVFISAFSLVVGLATYGYNMCVLVGFVWVSGACLLIQIDMKALGTDFGSDGRACLFRST